LRHGGRKREGGRSAYKTGRYAKEQQPDASLGKISALCWDLEERGGKKKKKKGVEGKKGKGRGKFQKK